MKIFVNSCDSRWSTKVFVMPDNLFGFLVLIVPGRQSGVGLNSVCARVGGIVAPLIWLLHVYHPAIPMALYGTAPFIGGFLCFLLPETLNVELEDHTEQRSEH